jgi:precorrin-4 C11-methyltransferase
MGCKKGAVAEDVCSQLREDLMERGYNPAAIASVSTVDIKKDEPMLHSVAREFVGENGSLEVYPAEDLKDIPVPNPSEKALAAAGTPSVAEASALKSSGRGKLLVEKQKRENFTFAVALDCTAVRGGHIEIVGAGPGDPELVSVRGKRMLEEADLILYAGSLVPKELTYYAKEGAVVRSSASMDLEEQFAVMKEFYDKGLFVVRLHTGDPCIYGAIQEQMAYFDKYNMSYHITPGISSFLAAAAELQSQFTIPEKVQTIILTRGEGRTAMPEREKLHMLAQHRSTMCIFLSATVVDQVQEELLMHYPPQTPVAACYKLTWKDQKIFRGELKDLAKIVKENNLTLTTMIVVGDSIGNREGLSRLYAHEFKHIFRH